MESEFDKQWKKYISEEKRYIPSIPPRQLAKIFWAETLKWVLKNTGGRCYHPVFDTIEDELNLLREQSPSLLTPPESPSMPGLNTGSDAEGDC